MTVFLDGMRLVADRSLVDLTTGASLVALFAAIALLTAREVWGRVAPASAQPRLPALVALAMPVVLVTIVTIVVRFVELAS